MLFQRCVYGIFRAHFSEGVFIVGRLLSFLLCRIQRFAFFVGGVGGLRVEECNVSVAGCYGSRDSRGQGS